MAIDRARTARGALAGAVAAGVWAAQQPLDQKLFGVKYDDTELLGKAVTRRRAWPVVGLAMHLANGARLRGRLRERRAPRAAAVLVARSGGGPGRARLDLAAGAPDRPRPPRPRRAADARDDAPAPSPRRPGATCSSASSWASSSGASTTSPTRSSRATSTSCPPTATATSSTPSRAPPRLAVLASRGSSAVEHCSCKAGVAGSNPVLGVVEARAGREPPPPRHGGEFQVRCSTYGSYGSFSRARIVGSRRSPRDQDGDRAPSSICAARTDAGADPASARGWPADRPASAGLRGRHDRLSLAGRRLAAVWAYGPTAVLSHRTAAAAWGLRASGGGRHRRHGAEHGRVSRACRDAASSHRPPARVDAPRPAAGHDARADDPRSRRRPRAASRRGRAEAG